jgi:hypothetical protein
MSKVPGVVLIVFILWAVASPATAPSQFELDHVWIMVSPDAPERDVLERTGFEISPDINRHHGQGTASYLSSPVFSRSTQQATGASRYRHGIGARRITVLTLISPGTYQPIAALK